jgi:hypothetical protein
VVVERGLVEAAPLLAEAGDGGGIEVAPHWRGESRTRTARAGERVLRD